MELKLQFGALCPTLKEQLRTAKLKYDSSEIAYLQKCLDSYNYLKLGDFITDKECYKIRERLNRKVISHVCKKNKLTLK